MSGWHPSLGAIWRGDRTAFRVWAPEADRVELVVVSGTSSPTVVDLGREAGGYFASERSDVAPGAQYQYLVDGRGPFPDPASRFQPEGVHGPSQVVDPTAFRWTDAAWRGLPLEELVFYEVHVGTATPEGTFRALQARLPEFHGLGVTAIELMPVADFPGNRNWGYDGVAPFAPARCYGRPDDLRALVDAAHALGLAVVLDVVYNHFGPDGAYQGSFSRHYFSTTHTSPWGAALNFDGVESGPVRAYVIENALHWIHEYHCDGLRLDATHAIVDAGPRHILAELAEAVHTSLGPAGRTVHLVAEDMRNLDRLVRSPGEGGYGLDAIWADDFHHELRVALAGDHDGYFRDFRGSTAEIAQTVRQGWYYHGQMSEHFGEPRGTDSTGIRCARFVVALQNHDQVGNRAFGDRLHHAIDPAAYRAASTLLVLLPETPLLFMGQEWAASTPFRYFTDHSAELGRAVTEGRRAEFRAFAAFADPASLAAIPDPQAPETFHASRLQWTEREREPHASTLRLYRRLLALRREALVGRGGERVGQPEITAWNDDVLVLRRPTADGQALLAIVRLRGDGTVDLRDDDLARRPPGTRWTELLSTEAPAYAQVPKAIACDADGPLATFARPGALVLALAPAEH